MKQDVLGPQGHFLVNGAIFATLGPKKLDSFGKTNSQTPILMQRALAVSK